MFRKSRGIDIVQDCAVGLSFSAVLAAFAVDRLKPLGVDLQTDTPVVEQFVDHAGNVVLGGMLAYAAIAGMKKIEQKAGKLTTMQRLAGVGTMSLAIGAGFNAIPDTQIGMNHVGKYIYDCENSDPTQDGRYCTVDPADFAWGTLATGLIAISMTEWRKREDQPNVQPASQSPASAGEPPLPQ